MMTKEEAAARLDGNEIGAEGSNALWAEMKDAGLVAVFGASDDLMEFRGAEYEEIGAYDGGIAYVTRAGLVSLDNECDNDRCPYHKKQVAAAEASATAIIACWDPGDGYSWRIETAIPHAPFIIMEGEDLFCRGVVFALADVPTPSPSTQEAEALTTQQGGE